MNEQTKEKKELILELLAKKKSDVWISLSTRKIAEEIKANRPRALYLLMELLNERKVKRTIVPSSTYWGLRR